ncbi:MAG: hypothetical protein JXR84_07630 [Anaerolineae bacterium]|nr:hypothetical protein [Anaerolineae bacterium]
MNRKNVLSWILNLGLVLLLVTACSTPQPAPTPTATPLPTATPAPPTDTPTPETPEWDYVALGDWPVMGMGDYSYAPHYAAYIEADMGVKVNLHIAGSPYQTTDQLLEQLRNDQALRDQISEAEVVTLVIGSLDMIEYIEDPCYEEENWVDCTEKELASTFLPNYNAILDELVTQCKSGLLIRTMTYPYVDADWAYDKGDERPLIKFLNESIIQVSAEHNIPVARVDIAFDGAEGLVTANGQSLLKPGAVKIAEAHRDLGYEPTVP